MTATSQLVLFVVISCQVLWSVIAQSQDGTMSLPLPDSAALQNDQQPSGTAMAGAGNDMGVSLGFGATQPGPSGPSTDLGQASMAGTNMASAGMATGANGGGYGSSDMTGSGMVGAGGYGSSGMTGSGMAGGYSSSGMAGAGRYDSLGIAGSDMAGMSGAGMAGMTGAGMADMSGAGMAGMSGAGMAGMSGAGMAGGTVGGYGSSRMAGAGGYGSSGTVGAGTTGGFGAGMPGSGGWDSGSESVSTFGRSVPIDMQNTPTYCYAHGPLLPEALLPKARSWSQVDVGNISCEEVVGYLMGLYRFYDRKCSRLGAKCPNKYKYAVSWFGTIGHQMSAKCNLTV